MSICDEKSVVLTIGAGKWVIDEGVSRQISWGFKSKVPRRLLSSLFISVGRFWRHFCGNWKKSFWCHFYCRGLPDCTGNQKPHWAQHRAFLRDSKQKKESSRHFHAHRHYRLDSGEDQRCNNNQLPESDKSASGTRIPVEGLRLQLPTICQRLILYQYFYLSIHLYLLYLYLFIFILQLPTICQRIILYQLQHSYLQQEHFDWN